MAEVLKQGEPHGDRASEEVRATVAEMLARIEAGGLEAVKDQSDISATVGWTPTLVALVVSFVVGYASIAWLLRLVARHPISVFVWYRVALAVVVAVLLLTGAVSAT